MMINREEEIKLIDEGVRRKAKIVIKGLRGVGKTTLLKYFCEKYNGLYVNCQRILHPEHLLLTLGIKEIISDAYQALEIFFDTINKEVRLLALDEFTDLLRNLGTYKPYRGRGGTNAVAMHLRALLEESEIPILFSTTSLKALYDVAGEYSKPLARSFDIIITLHPLPFESAIELLDLICSERRINCSREAKIRVAELTGGNPSYIKAITSRLVRRTINVNDIDEIFIRELSEGYLNALFEGLQRELSLGEVIVLYIISRGYTRFNEIEKRARGLNLSQVLNTLIRRGLIKRAKLDRETHYVFVDKTMAIWFALEPYPGLEKMTYDTARIVHAAFESLIRELFMHINKPIETKDAMRRNLVIQPMKKVSYYRGKLGEIDMIAQTTAGTIVAEIYFGEKADTNKLRQLERNIAIAETLGENVTIALLISYFGFKKELIDQLEKSPAKNIIYLLDKDVIRTIAKAVGYRSI